MPTTVISVKINGATYQKARSVLDEIGLSASDAIGMLMRRIANDQRFPFEVKIPNAETREAIEGLRRGEGKPFNTVEEFMADLYADD